MRLLIDGDIIVYRAGFAVEPTVYSLLHHDCRVEQKFPAGTKKADIDIPEGCTLISEKVPEPVEHALNAAKMTINSILNRCRYTAYTIFLSHEDDEVNFRYEVARHAPYKGNRQQAKPVHYHAIREYLTKRYDAQIVSDGEADDQLGIEMMKDPENGVIVTIDKDLDMIPGWHFNFVKDKKYHITPEDADRNFYRQLLMGDTVDNIKGIPGIGPKKAEKILQDVETKCGMEYKVKHQYKEYYGDVWREVMEEMGRLLWIRRKEGELWQIPE